MHVYVCTYLQSTQEAGSQNCCYEDAVTHLQGFATTYIEINLSEVTLLTLLCSERICTFDSFSSVAKNGTKDGSKGGIGAYFCCLLHSPAIYKELRG